MKERRVPFAVIQEMNSLNVFLFSLQLLPKDTLVVVGWNASSRLQQEIVGSHFILLQKGTGLYIGR